MSKLIIHGGKPLCGTVTPVPNKNSILKIIPACVLTNDPVTIHHVPQTSDVKYMIQILEKLGGSATRISDTSIRINGGNLTSQTIDPDLSEKMKAGVMFAGPLLARYGRALMPAPQGCKLGTRPLDVLLENMVHMGVEETYTNGVYELVVKGKKCQGNKIWQRFPSVTGTENLILIAVLAEGTTEIYNAACEPHTQDLCNMLVAMGAHIQGIGSNKLTIEGIDTLHGTERTVVSDHLDVGGYIAAAAMTHGEVTIQNACVEHMGLIVQMMANLGVRVIVDAANDTIHVPADQELIIKKTAKGNPRRTHAFNWPLLPPDFVHSCVVLALKASGQAIFDNLFYEYGFFFVQELAKMKANVIMANPVTVITTGPTDFKPANLVCSDIIQASYGLLLATLAAKGTSTLNAITPLFRRFPDFISKFQSLGAELEMTE